MNINRKEKQRKNASTNKTELAVYVKRNVFYYVMKTTVLTGIGVMNNARKMMNTIKQTETRRSAENALSACHVR